MRKEDPASALRVLSIEDDPDLQYLLSRALRDEGLQLSYAFTGTEGLEQAAAVQPHLILLDLMLPRLSGPDVLKRLMEAPETQHIPVIVMTAYSGEPKFFEDDLMALGAVAYLRKPIRFAQLIPLMRRVMGREAPPPR
jgi:CheY-like chemotaxis protein